MRRAVAFAQDIATSKQADVFPKIVDAYRGLLDDRADDGHTIDTTNLDLRCEVRHVDGTFNALQRNGLLWPGSSARSRGINICRILSNARCLSEGVDVPALDAVMFLHPRKRTSSTSSSPSAGSCARPPARSTATSSFPIGVPAGMRPEEALADNKRYKVVWEVLQALRAHDERFNAMVNAIDSTADKDSIEGTTQLFGDHLGPGDDAVAIDDSDSATTDSTPIDVATQLVFSPGRRVARRDLRPDRRKVGDRRYWEHWARDIARHRRPPRHPHQGAARRPRPSTSSRRRSSSSTPGCGTTSTTRITRDDAIAMLSQHLITRPVFDALFGLRVHPAQPGLPGDAGDDRHPRRQRHRSGDRHARRFYETSDASSAASTPPRADSRSSPSCTRSSSSSRFPRQPSRSASSTPRSRSSTSSSAPSTTSSAPHFGAGLSDEGVHILDPFTGTGTFITRLLQSGLIRPQRPAPQVRQRAARQRDHAARLLHRRRQHRDHATGLPSPAATTSRSTGSCSPTRSR